MISTATTPTAARLMTAEEFYEWSIQPENAARHCELEDGRIVDLDAERPPNTPSPGELHGAICAIVVYLLQAYSYGRGSGRVLSNDSGVQVRVNTVQGADVLLYETARPVSNLAVGYATDIPTLAVEVFSPSDRPGRLNRRIGRYHAYGIPLVWVVYPEEYQVDVHRPNQAIQTFDLGDTLQNFPELPGFSTTVAALFTLPGQHPPTATH